MVLERVRKRTTVGQGEELERVTADNSFQKCLGEGKQTYGAVNREAFKKPEVLFKKGK